MSDRFNELLPWYVNGTLDEADRAWMDEHLATHPQAREELAWFQSLQAQLRHDAPAVPRTIGLSRTLHLIRGDRPTLAERFTGFFAGLGMRPSMALAGVALIAVQGGVIYNLQHPGADDVAQWRAVGRPIAAQGPVLKLTFAPGAREVDIRLALVSVQGSMASGPGPQGEYWVRVPSGTEAASVDHLKNQVTIDSVSLAQDLRRP